MIRCHPRVNDSNFKILIQEEVQNVEVTGYISEMVLKLLFNLFTWVYIEGNTVGAYETTDSAIYSLLKNVDLDLFKGPSACYSSVLLYNKLRKAVNIRQLERNSLDEVKTGENKVLDITKFPFEELYDMYRTGKGDLSKDFMLFNRLFINTEEARTSAIKNYGDISRVSGANIVRPDFTYKLATKSLQVRYAVEKEAYDDRLLIILQDCTVSMSSYLDQIKMVKGYILNEAFKNDYRVEWLLVNTEVVDEQVFDKNNIKNIGINNAIMGSQVNTSGILTQDRFFNKKVIIITDGTDPFDFKFNTKTMDVNMISFNENVELRNIIANHGRFFKVTR